MPTILTNGIQLPDKGSVDWYGSMQSNYNLIDAHLGDTDVHVTAEDKANWNSKQGSLSQAQLDAIAQVATNTDDIASLQSGKANASHTHSSNDITDIGDYATKQYVDNSISGLVDNAPAALDTLKELSTALNDDANFASTVATALSAKANSADLATVATSGSYTDLTDKPTINDSTITIQKNGSTVDTFTTNGSAKTINIPVPTKTSDLTNDSNFVDTSNSAVASGITSAKVTSYDSHIADTNIHVTTADKNKWNNGVAQAYVFRYSSTALVASSTNSNTLLDNTDNLKVGDKVIDSSGVLFSITAIDTQNSTFTIGTALIDLAQDSDVVHKSGNETVGGEKTFNNLQIIGYGTQYKGARDAYILPEFSAGYSGLSITTLSYPQTLKIGNFVLDANNKPSLDTSKGYIQIATGENNGVNACTLEARNNTSSSLGTSANRWSKIYGTEYYYGSNNVEFSTKFVTTDTNQTISGNKTFTNNISLKSLTAEYTVTGASISVTYSDKNDLLLAQNKLGNYQSGVSYNKFSIFAYDSNNQLIDRTLTFSSSNNALTSAYFRPDNDNIVSLGTTGNRWSRVYATNYYYGSNNVEFSTKFVTTDTNQTISGVKNFAVDVGILNTDTTANTPNLNLRNYKVDRGTTDAGVQTITFLDKNAKALTLIESRRISNGSTGTNILTYNTDDSNNAVSGGISIIKSKTETNFAPTVDNAVTCGRPLAKWSDVQTYKVNNLEPSSLSLPSDRSARIDISSYITNLGNGDNNQYIVPANGYIWLHFTSINSALCYSQTSGGLTNYAQTFVRYQGDGQLYAFFPVRKNDYFIVQIYTSSTAVVQNAYFIPCQGNV